MTKKLISILAFVLIIIVFLKFGRSIYIPILNKIKGKETVESRIKNIEENVWNRLEKNLNLAGYKMDYPSEIILVAFKEEKTLEVYSKDYNRIKKIRNIHLQLLVVN